MHTMPPPAGLELVKQVPLTAVAYSLSFFNQYGALVVTLLAIVYGVMQIYLRRIEHRMIVEKYKGAT